MEIKNKKGNPATLKSYKKGEQRTIENASKGGKKKKENADKRKSMTEALKAILYAKSEINPDALVMDEWLKAVMEKMLLNPDSKDLKIIAELLGEINNKLSVEADVSLDSDIVIEIL